MPNHVTHRVIVASANRAALETFISTFIRVQDEGGEPCFDFNAIVPMPASIRNTESSSDVGIGLAMMGRNDVPSGFGGSRDIEDYLNYPYYKSQGILTVEALVRHVMENNPRVIDAAKNAIKAYEETGHTSWYDWSIANWGTKWNAYSFVPGEIVEDDNEAGVFTYEFRFDTAWSPPTPVFEVLAGRPEMKDIQLGTIAFDEGWNFAWMGAIKDGVFEEAPLEATKERYALVYGHEYESDEDEEEVLPSPVNPNVAQLESTVTALLDAPSQ